MYVKTVAGCNGQRSRASVVKTDDEVGTEHQSELIDSHSTQLDVSSVHHELVRKNEQLKFLRQMLKEVRLAS